MMMMMMLMKRYGCSLRRRHTATVPNAEWGRPNRIAKRLYDARLPFVAIQLDPSFGSRPAGRTRHCLVWLFDWRMIASRVVVRLWYRLSRCRCCCSPPLQVVAVAVKTPLVVPQHGLAIFVARKETPVACCCGDAVDCLARQWSCSAGRTVVVPCVSRRQFLWFADVAAVFVSRPFVKSHREVEESE